MKRSSRRKKKFIVLNKMNDFDKIINFYSYENKIGIFVKSLSEMEELKRLTFDTIARRKLVEDRETIFPRYKSTSVFLTSSSSRWNAKPFSGNAEPQNWAAKHLGHTWKIGKRFCKSSSVFFSTLSAGVESMEFEYIRTHSLIKSEDRTPAYDQRCQSGPSARNSFIPSEGEFSKNYGADQQRLQISDLHFDKFTTPATFACWKIRFKTEVCTCSQFPTEAMLWIKEVETVDSVDDLKSSCSVRGIRMPDFEVLDAKIASALNRIIHNTQFKRKVSLEEQQASKEDRFLRGRQIAHLIYEYFRVTGANDSVDNYANLFTIVLRNDDIQEFDSKWDGISSSMMKIPSGDILENCTN